MSNPTVRAAAPLRISFVGGGTDFPHYFRREGGAVLSATIDQYAWVTIQRRRDREIRIRSLDLGHQVGYHLDEGPVYDGVMDLAKAAIERVGVEGGIEVDVSSDAPPGSGLGGSSALVTAIVAGLAALDGRSYSREEVARLSTVIEREDLRVAGGWQDQYATAFGGFNLIEFASAGVTVTPLDLVPGRLAELRGNLLLCYTGAVRTNLGLIDTQIRLFHEGREETIQGMKQLHEMAFEMRDALERGDLDALGRMLHEAYEAKKRMNPHIAEGTPIERLFEVAHDAGALGGKICGAGGGGFLLVYCPIERQERLEKGMRDYREMPFRLEPDGSKVIFNYRRDTWK